MSDEDTEIRKLRFLAGERDHLWQRMQVAGSRRELSDRYQNIQGYLDAAVEQMLGIDDDEEDGSNHPKPLAP